MGKNAYTDRFLDIVFSHIKPLSKKDFAESIGLNKNKFRNIEIGANGVPIDALCVFLETYPHINANYILTGRGSMFLESIETDESDDIVSINKENQERVLMLQSELKDAYEEIGRLNMELNKKARRS